MSLGITEEIIVRQPPEAQAIIRLLLARVLVQKPSEYEIPDGLRPLATSRCVLDRILTLGMAYRLDDDKRFVGRA
jgi:hypothetical protein